LSKASASCPPPACSSEARPPPASFSGARPPDPPPTARASNDRQASQNHGASSSGATGFCEPCRVLDDIAEEFKCCKKGCLANIGTPAQIARLKAGLFKDSKSTSVKVSLYF